MISNVTIHRFTGTGISLDVNHDTTVIRNSFITNTSTNCIFVSGGRSAVELLNNTFQDNGKSAYATSVVVSSINYYVSFYANGNTFYNNNATNMLKLFIPYNVARSVIRIANNDILNNTCENLVDVEYTGHSCMPSSLQTIVLANNYWRNNQMRSTSVILKGTSYSYCTGYKTNVLLMENYFLDNIGRGIVDIQSGWSTSIMLTSNFLQRNVLEKSAIIVTALQGSNSDISLLHNRFFNNTAEKLVDVTENSAMVVIRNNIMVHNEVDKSIINLVTENSDRVSSFNFTRNSLIANGLRPRYLSLPSNAINNVAAVICSSRQISVNENFFENPLFPWEFMLTPFFEPYEIDGKYNWWGSKDVKEIILKIFDFRWRNYLPRLKFSPFLASANLTDVSTGETRVTFRNGNVLGGHVTDYIVLEKDSSPYTVIRDVVIYPNATLTIEKGVQINVFPDIGFHVYGKLELLGERNTPIQFDITTKFIKDFANFGAYPLRLVNGSKSWEGIVEIFYNNTWGTICDDGNSNSNGIVLCKQLGYQSYSGSYTYTPSSSSTKPVWWRYLRCNPNIHHDISTCSFDGWGVSCYGGLWTVRCDPGYWRGIRFRETAKASQISHVKFERGGGQIRNDISSYVLHFDVLRQAVSDVEIHDPFRGGIKIVFQEPGFVINNVLIRNDKGHGYGAGHGIETSSALTCYNCSVFGTDRGFYFPEFNIQNFLYEIEVKPVDFLVAPTFMLRKEIPMCEQNMSVIIGINDMKIITMSKSSYSYQDVECFLTVSILSRITLVATEISLLSDETFTISKSNLNSSNGTEFTLRQHDVYIIGPGNLTLRYWRKAWSSGSRKRLVIFSSEGNMSLKFVVFNHTSKIWVLDYRV